MKVIFFIESLHSGGKERLLLELCKGLVKFYKICKSYEPDIIHVWGNMVAIYSILAKVILKIPLVNNQIVNAPLKIKKGLLSYKTTFLFSDIIVANSYAGLDAYNAPKDKSIVIYNGIDLNRLKNTTSPLKIRGKFGITSKFVVGMLATFSRTKDYTTYILAAKDILKKNKDVTFLCIGSGDDKNFKKIVDSQLYNKIKFLGFQDDVESILNICDIGVLSTFTEGISMAIMEFMTLGKPVVATDGGGTKELIVDGETGLLVRPRSKEELSAKIEFLLQNEKKAVSMGIKGKKRIQENFSLKKMVENYIRLYESTICR